MLPVSRLDYHLPEDRIALRPAEPRDAARLMVISRSDESLLHHLHIRDLPSLLNPHDLLIFNTTKVLPARLHARWTISPSGQGGGRVEALFLRESAPSTWSLLLSSKRRLRPGATLELLHEDGSPSSVILQLLARESDTDAPSSGGDDATQPASFAWSARLLPPHDTTPAPQLLSSLGATPLPPYILRARAHAHLSLPDALDRDWYQTVFAQTPGSVAAPTAGLHFTPELLSTLSSRNVHRAHVTLHVGLATFKPIETDTVESHPMHAEWCDVPRATLNAISTARSRSARAIAVGTTTARALESASHNLLTPSPDSYSGPTRILISPGHSWSACDALLTNFHLPRSTLLAMVASLLVPQSDLHSDSARDHALTRLLHLYKLAIRDGYRFYSYGDAMLILP